MRACIRGWQEFQCDEPECGRGWRVATRDHQSPSGSVCPDCSGIEFPVNSWEDFTLPVDAFGNIGQDPRGLHWIRHITIK